jgi:hypothetical protein
MAGEFTPNSSDKHKVSRVCLPVNMKVVVFDLTLNTIIPEGWWEVPMLVDPPDVN